MFNRWTRARIGHRANAAGGLGGSYQGLAAEPAAPLATVAGPSGAEMAESAPMDGGDCGMRPVDFTGNRRFDRAMRSPGPALIRGLTEFRDALRDGVPIAERFIVREVRAGGAEGGEPSALADG